MLGKGNFYLTFSSGFGTVPEGINGNWDFGKI